MTCPICSSLLNQATLLAADSGEPELRGFRCPDGHGVFLPSDLYFAWRDRHEPPTEPSGHVPSSDEVGDVKRAKLCPQDGRIMRRARVSLEGGFWLDRCGTCGGVWFDGSEWDATVTAGLLDVLPSFFSDAWTRQTEEVRAAEHWQHQLEARVGKNDLDRIDAFRSWAWSHPEREVVFARLNERPMG